MDFASIIGIVSGLIAVAGTIMMGSGLGTFVNLPSLLVVFGGTLAATLVAFPLKDFLMVVSQSVRVFFFRLDAPEELVALLVDISNKSRKNGLLAIEEDLAEIDNPFLTEALRQVVDGVSTPDIAQIMEKKMANVKKKARTGYNIFKTMGTYAPAFGMVGTLIGLIQMLATLDDPSTIGPKMAVAMITTFYGALSANLIFSPMSDKLKLRSEEEAANMRLLYEGVLSIREGEHPRLMQDKLRAYLEDEAPEEN